MLRQPQKVLALKQITKNFNAAEIRATTCPISSLIHSKFNKPILINQIGYDSISKSVFQNSRMFSTSTNDDNSKPSSDSKSDKATVEPVKKKTRVTKT